MSNDELVVPEDIRKYDLNAFLAGPIGDGEEPRKLDIDDIFAKDFGRAIEEARQYHGERFLDPRSFRFHRQSDLDQSMRYARFEGGTLLIWDDEEALIGGFIETDLSIDAEWHGQGLGTELVVEHFMDSGSLPTWHLDNASYSFKGLRACSAAHAFPSTHPDIYFTKAARHVMSGNVRLFRPAVEAKGYPDTLLSLKAALVAAAPGGLEDAARQWLAQIQTDLTTSPP